MTFSRLRTVVILGLVCVVGFLVGCAGMEHMPGGKYFLYHNEMVAARNAVEAARRAGKDKECPAEFQAVEKLKKDAFATYDACHTAQAIAMANDVVARANALCPKVEAPKAVAPAAAAPVIVSFSAASSSVEQGKCTTLTWTSQNATSTSIDEGVGSVDPNGSREVCPASTTRYTLTASGAGGSQAASTTITVIPAAPPAPIDRLTVHVNFDTDKAEIRKSEMDDLKKAVAFVQKYPGATISVEGHTDSTGSNEYNQALSERRAEAVKKYLVEHGGVAADKITAKGFGETRPIASNDTAKGRAENRRVEIVIVSR
jgi:outer membrane protein OmpA-like peptidoglycan-associated protein